MFITLSIITTIWNIIIFLVVLGLVICIHELGHFLFAKRAGILCHEFSFGMGPRIYSKKFGETVFSIRAIPFGGYVSMAGEEIEDSLVKVGQKVRLGFNEFNEVNRIIIDVSNVAYKDYLVVKVEKIDLSSSKDSKLFINEYTVNRTAMYVTNKDSIQIAPIDRNYIYKSTWQRFITAFGGPLMNFVLAFFLFLIIAFSVGVPRYDESVIGEVNESLPAASILLEGDEIIKINDITINSWDGDNHSVKSELSKINSEYIIVVNRDGSLETLSVKPQLIFFGLGFTSTINNDALLIGTPLYINTELQAGDLIVSIDGLAMSSWDDVMNYAINHTDGSTEDNPTTIVVKRNGQELTFEYVAYGADVLDAMGYESFNSRIGISCETGFSFFGSFGSAWNSFVSASTSIYKTIGLMFSSNQVKVSDLSGFVGIFSMTSRAAAGGMISLLSWIGLLSVNLGIVNLLPIPALDGGKIVFIGYEMITKKKPNQKVENLIHTVMFFILMGLLVYITYFDILRLVGIK